jgi:malonate transporter
MPLTTLLPVFLVAAIGALLVKLPWLRSGWHAGVTELAAKFLLPVLLMVSTYRTGMPASMSWQVLCAFYLPLALLFGGARLLARTEPAATALAATYSNTVFVGLPVLVQALGPGSLQFALPVIAFHSLFCFTLYHLSDEHGARGWTGPVLNTLRNPIVAALLLGLALNLAGIRLPQPLLKSLDILAAAASPCALLSLGGSVALLKPGGWLPTCAVSASKLLLFPLAVLLLAVFVFRLPAAAAAVLVVLAACPVGVNAAFVVAPGGEGARLVNSAILLSSLACALTIPGWLWLLRQV